MIADLLAQLGFGRVARLTLRLGLLVVTLILLLLSRRRSEERLGRVLERLKASERSNDVQREMLEAAARRPRDRGELAGACGTVGSDRAAVAVCPPVVDYGAELQVRAAAELKMLPHRTAVEALLSDYAVMRDQAGACNGR
jgi:hypothetical protein